MRRNPWRFANDRHVEMRDDAAAFADALASESEKTV
jgi:hypothetical protein